ncbi:MAG: S-adenosylmethionine:tRNA ribosyltransferase-isomerase [Dermatophilaceae bacterium]
MTAVVGRPATRFSPSAFASLPAESRGLARDEVRLLVARPSGIRHVRFRDLHHELDPGDLVVVNTSATVPAELDGRHTGRGEVVIHVASRLDDGSRVVELRTAPHAERAVLDAQPGHLVTAGAAVIRLVEPYPFRASPTGVGNRLWRATVSGDLDHELAARGRPIAYGYLERPLPLEMYQTVFGIRGGSAEMPSAGRPFTTELVTRLVAAGVGVAPVTLHTGVSSQEAGEGPQPEWFEVPEATAAVVNTTRAAGRRVVAVGTTVTRALESAVADDAVVVRSGWTDRVVTADHPPQVVNGLVSGWHDPAASHLLLVEAVAGEALTQAAYDEAAADGYLWHEFGDSALFLP